MVVFKVLPITQRLGNSLRERRVRRKAVVPLREGPPHLRFRARGYRFVSRGYRFARGRHNCGFVPGGIASRAGGIASRGAVPVVFFFPWVSLREGPPHMWFLGGGGARGGGNGTPSPNKLSLLRWSGGEREGGGLAHLAKHEQGRHAWLNLFSCGLAFSTI